jgi:hypothetical protein
MAQIQNITVNNGSADVTFIPMSKDGLDCRWSHPRTSASLSERIQVIGHQVKTGTNRKLEIRFTQPFEYTSPNEVKSVKTSLAKIVVSIPQEATTEDITALRVMLSNLLMDAIIADAIDYGALPY